MAKPGRHSRRWLLLVAAVLIAGGVGIKYGRHYVFAKRFAEVVPGHIYRSGQLESGPLRCVIDGHKIRTILTLLGEERDDPEQKQEIAITAEKGVRLVRIGMPGDGRGKFDELEQAAAMLANESLQPILVHCSAGVNRTGAVCAVWRMKYCGWTLEQALDEAEARGYSPVSTPQLGEHLREYYRTRIAGSQPATVPG